MVPSTTLSSDYINVIQESNLNFKRRNKSEFATTSHFYLEKKGSISSPLYKPFTDAARSGSVLSMRRCVPGNQGGCGAVYHVSAV